MHVAKKLKSYMEGHTALWVCGAWWEGWAQVLQAGAPGEQRQRAQHALDDYLPESPELSCICSGRHPMCTWHDDARPGAPLHSALQGSLGAGKILPTQMRI